MQQPNLYADILFENPSTKSRSSMRCVRRSDHPAANARPYATATRKFYETPEALWADPAAHVDPEGAPALWAWIDPEYSAHIDAKVYTPGIALVDHVDACG